MRACQASDSEEDKDDMEEGDDKASDNDKVKEAEEEKSSDEDDGENGEKDKGVKEENRKVSDNATDSAKLSRPSAAAVGFCTVGLTDEQVLDKAAKFYKEGKKLLEKDLKELGLSGAKVRDDKAGVASSSTSSTSSKSSSSSSTSSSGSKKGKEDAEKDTRDRTYSVRTEFPKTNIRRWMTPGPRFDVPPNLPSRDDITQEGQKFKQTEIDWIKPPTDLLKETEKKKTKEKEEKKAKDEELPIPVHRRRTKSWRHLT